MPLLLLLHVVKQSLLSSMYVDALRHPLAVYICSVHTLVLTPAICASKQCLKDMAAKRQQSPTLQIL